MKRNKIVLYVLWLLLLHSKSFANLIYHPVSFVLSTDKESYYEGEKITFYITITNNDKERTHPVLLPHTQNTGEKLFYLTAYDKAKNTLLLRYTENKQMNMMVHDTGTVQIKYLKPQEQIVVPIYLNDFENYYSYHTQNASHHSFGVPLFAGIYHINVTYNPKGLALGDSLYTYYDYFDKYSAPANKQLMPREGQITPLVEVRIKRRTDTIVSIERKKYFIKTDGYYYYYLSENLPKITTDTNCHHITSLLPDSFTGKNEYFYSHFTDLYAEYISRFEDGDIREYRKFSDWCPSYLFTERYNEFKQKTHYELQLPDKRFYSISYHQPGGRIHQESYCSEDGTLCMVTTYIYNKKGDFVRKKMEQTKPCSVVIIDGKKRSATRVYNLEAR
ncbi:MAG: hypothetical protein ACK5UI_03340 [Bacteroidota bacterium]